ncbi:MAG: glycosyltransferase family 2 protein, partial [Campylobacteraceae bacterium]|nr:glycosyltransferase family 2 protein [Campylobacteraceae bacterium]
MPCYNCIDSIAESVNSVLNQTYKNIELIVVDDHSMDGTWDKLLKYSNND